MISFESLSDSMRVLYLEEVNKNRTSQIRSITHELRTPVNGTINYLDAALQDSSVDEKIKK